MSRRIVPLSMFFGILVAIAGGWLLFAKTERNDYIKRSQIAHSDSDIRLSMQVDYDSGPLVQERYMMRNRNGVSTSDYVGISRAGTKITISSTPRETYDVTFFFERIVADGIWKLTNKPARGNTNAHYTVEIYQLVAGQKGSRAIVFTDPHYWATTGGHQYHIHLDRNKPVPDLLSLQATSIQDPGYEKVVDEFRAFGTDSFRAKVAQAQARLRG